MNKNFLGSSELQTTQIEKVQNEKLFDVLKPFIFQNRINILFGQTTYS